MRRKPVKRIVASEFFAGEIVDIGGPYQTWREQKQVFDWLTKEQKENPVYSEEANTRVMEKYTLRAQAETRYKEDAQKVLERVSDLQYRIRQGDLHGAVYAAMLLQQDYTKLILRQREPDAKTGRVHKARSREGVAITNEIRKQKPNPLEAKVQADYKRYLKTEHPRKIAGMLARKYQRTPARIRQLLNTPEEKRKPR